MKTGTVFRKPSDAVAEFEARPYDPRVPHDDHSGMTYERAHLKAMQGYVPGQQPDTGAIKLNTNENPYPPGAAVAHALNSFPLEMLRRYPDPLAGAFRASVARLRRLAPANVIATNGGDELIRLALTTFLDPGKPLGLLTPSYGLYSVLAGIHGSPLAGVPLGDDWSVPHDTAERWNAAGAPLAIMTNPHAPSGRLTAADELHELALSFRGVLLVDEAYVDFVDPEIGHETSTMAAACPNVLLLRTLSKGYSLAGLRLAYGLGAAELVAPMLSKTKDSYNVDAVAQAVGTAALEDVRTAARSWTAVRHERRALDLALTAVGFPCAPSQANFLLATVPAGAPWHSAENVYRSLMARGIFVRWFDEAGLRDKLRISIGTPEENRQLVEALRRLGGS
jgi:histidinol-phosphate aminotransferase